MSKILEAARVLEREIDEEIQLEDLLGESFPEKLWLVKAVGAELYLCFCLCHVDNLHAVACFSEKAAAGEARLMAAEVFVTRQAELVHVTFDQAREIAKARPPQVIALALLDDFLHPVVHYVR